jgi:GNAT superfamily N-acetyltransferase
VNKINISFTNKISVKDYMILRKTADWKDITKKQAKTGLKNSVYLLSVKYGGKTVGMARIVGDGGYVMLIVDVIVLPECQGLGVGMAIMGKVMEYLGELARGGDIKAHLMALAGKEGFYEKCGFRARPYDRFGNGMSMAVKRGRP